MVGGKEVYKSALEMKLHPSSKQSRSTEKIFKFSMKSFSEVFVSEIVHKEDCENNKAWTDHLIQKQVEVARKLVELYQGHEINLDADE